jgi:hypothetical protein
MHCAIPPCATCLFGKAHKHPKQTKTKHSIAPEARSQGNCVSMDVLQSPTPGLVTQMAGFLTCQCYLYACMFVDHYSDFTYIHLMKDQNGEGALEAKEAFEAYSAAHGIEVKRYHADNGIFACAQWKEHCFKSHQLLTYATIGAHQQNGKAERRIQRGYVTCASFTSPTRHTSISSCVVHEA